MHRYFRYIALLYLLQELGGMLHGGRGGGISLKLLCTFIWLLDDTVVYCIIPYNLEAASALAARWRKT